MTARRVVRSLAWSLLGVTIVGATLYLFFGLRVVLDGGGGFHLRFVESAQAHADSVERDRAAQRARDSASQTQDAPAVSPPASAVASATAAPSTDAPWPDFRGPARDGRSTDAVLTTWPAGGLKPLWKQPVGGGYASFVIAAGRAFTIEQRGSREVIAAYDMLTGRERWTNGYDASFTEIMGGDGPRATPTWSAGLIYALGALGELRCVDATSGKLVWRTNILDDNGAQNLQWAMSSAPLVVGETVIVLPGGAGGKSVVAYNRLTGARVWSALSDKAGYASPMLVSIAGTRQLLVVTGSRVVGLTPDRGELMWEFPWTTNFDINAAQPLVVGDNRVFMSSGYGVGAAVVEVTNTNGRFAAREIWRNTRMKNKFASSVLHDGFIYGLDESILACVDAATGELKWKGGRYGFGQVMLASGHLIVLTEDGELALVRATPEGFDERARFEAITGKTWNHPAMAGGKLLVRNMQEMAAFDLRVR